MAGKQRRVLIADDDMEDIDILTDAFLQLDDSLVIDTVENGGQVLQFLAGRTDEELPCMIVLDYKMPILNAAEVLERCKIIDRYQTIPKIVWSTSGQQEDMNRCLQAGAEKYFIKPSRANDLQTIAIQILHYCK